MNWLERLNVLMEQEGGAEGGDAGGGGGDGGSGGTELQLQQKLSKYGNDAFALARDLYTDNYKARERARKAEARVKELEPKVPGEDAVVLTGEDAKTYSQFKDLGKSPEEVKRAFEIEGEYQVLQRQRTHEKAAEIMGWNDKALTDLLSDKEVNIVGEGEKAQVEVILGEDQKKPLKEWVEGEKAHFLPSLTSGKEGQGVHFGAGGGQGGQSSDDTVGDWLKERNKAEESAKNPLEG